MDSGRLWAVNTHPRTLQTTAYISVLRVAVSWAGFLAKIFAPLELLRANGWPPNTFRMLPVGLATVDV